MNEELQNALATVIKGVTEFSQDQLPDVINQYLAYQYTSNVVMIVTLSVLLFLSIVLIVVAAIIENTEVQEIFVGIGIMTFTIVFISSIIAIPLGVIENLGIKNNPKGYLLEKVINKVNK